MIRKNRKVWESIALLVLLEQSIKIVINKYYLQETFAILPPFLFFEPMFNRDYSWFNSMLQLGVSKWAHIIVVAAMSILLLLFYGYLTKHSKVSTMLHIMFAFIFSGALCSLIDKVFWDGSLDYIAVSGLFTFDLKDVYINIFNGLLILSLLTNNKAFKQITDEDMLRAFARHLIDRRQN